MMAWGYKDRDKMSLHLKPFDICIGWREKLQARKFKESNLFLAEDNFILTLPYLEEGVIL